MILPAFIERQLYLAARSLLVRTLQRENDELKAKLRACETDLAQSRAHVAAVRQVCSAKLAAVRRAS